LNKNKYILVQIKSQIILNLIIKKVNNLEYTNHYVLSFAIQTIYLITNVKLVHIFNLTFLSNNIGTCNLSSFTNMIKK